MFSLDNSRWSWLSWAMGELQPSEAETFDALSSFLDSLPKFIFYLLSKEYSIKRLGVNSFFGL